MQVGPSTTVADSSHASDIGLFACAEGYAPGSVHAPTIIITTGIALLLQQASYLYITASPPSLSPADWMQNTSTQIHRLPCWHSPSGVRPPTDTSIASIAGFHQQ
eukprot:356877-Chlamydomonas_euryale.AAC.12